MRRSGLLRRRLASVHRARNRLVVKQPRCVLPSTRVARVNCRCRTRKSRWCVLKRRKCDDLVDVLLAHQTANGIINVVFNDMYIVELFCFCFFRQQSKKKSSRRRTPSPSISSSSSSPADSHASSIILSESSDEPQWQTIQVVEHD